jgi:hypothetical protein
MFVGERISFLKLAGVVDRTAGDEFTGVTTGEPLKGELLRDLMSMRGFGGKLRPEAFDVALPGLRGWTREASGASSSEELSEESEVSSLLAAEQIVMRITYGKVRNERTWVLGRLDGCGLYSGS